MKKTKTSKSGYKGTALVTGGANRIGRGIALHLASSGYKVALHYHNSKKPAEKTAGMIRNKNGVCETFRCDLSDENDTSMLIGEVYKRFPDLNLLINNASVFEKSGLRTVGMDIFNRQFAVNFRAPYILTVNFARIVSTGHIINILDTNIVKNRTDHTAYLLSKKSLADLTKLSSVELAPKIRVNGVAPGLILPPAGEGSSYMDRLAKKVPLKKKGNVAAVTVAIDSLVENKYITGQIIYVDGGQHLI